MAAIEHDRVRRILDEPTLISETSQPLAPHRAVLAERIARRPQSWSGKVARVMLERKAYVPQHALLAEAERVIRSTVEEHG
jgi:hypothetical protein